MNKLSVIIDLLKQKYFLRSDTQVAEKLRMKTTTFAERKRTDSIPFEIIIDFCERENISLDWLLLDRPDLTAKLKDAEAEIENLKKEIEKNERNMKLFEYIISKLPPGEYK